MRQMPFFFAPAGRSPWIDRLETVGPTRFKEILSPLVLSQLRIPLYSFFSSESMTGWKACPTQPTSPSRCWSLYGAKYSNSSDRLKSLSRQPFQPVILFLPPSQRKTSLAERLRRHGARLVLEAQFAADFFCMLA